MHIGLIYSEIQDLKTEISFCVNHRYLFIEISVNLITFPLFSQKNSDHENFTDLQNALSWTGSDIILKSNGFDKLMQNGQILLT